MLEGETLLRSHAHTHTRARTHTDTRAPAHSRWRTTASALVMSPQKGRVRTSPGLCELVFSLGQET